jgi:hypothetical protein
MGGPAAGILLEWAFLLHPAAPMPMMSGRNIQIKIRIILILFTTVFVED